MQQSLVLAVLVNCVAAGEWYFRGTPNNWGSNLMRRRIESFDGDCHTEYFEANGAFKVSSSDVKENWPEAYPAENWVVREAGYYDVCFREDTKKITAWKMSSYTGPYLRSSATNWEAVTPLTFIHGKYGLLRYARVQDFEAGEQFKVSVTKDWNDGSVPEQNYVIPQAGRYLIEFSRRGTDRKLSVTRV